MLITGYTCRWIESGQIRVEQNEIVLHIKKDQIKAVRAWFRCCESFRKRETCEIYLQLRIL